MKITKLKIVIALTLMVFLWAIFFVVRSNQNELFFREFISHFEDFSYEQSKQRSSEISTKTASTTEAVHIPIIVYHSIRPHILNESKIQEEFDITPELFAEELKYLKENNYTTISFDVLADHFEKNTPLPPKSIILTFDDGWENQYRYAFPLLQKYAETGTFFIFTNAIGHKHFLSWKQIFTMRNAGMSIGGHTVSHPYLFHIKDKKRLEEEIAGGKKTLELRLGKPVTSFAYPFGEHNDDIVSVVKEAGYRIARSSDFGREQTKDRIFILYSIPSTDIFADFKKSIEEK